MSVVVALWPHSGINVPTKQVRVYMRELLERNFIFCMLYNLNYHSQDIIHTHTIFVFWLTKEIPLSPTDSMRLLGWAQNPL